MTLSSIGPEIAATVFMAVACMYFIKSELAAAGVDTRQIRSIFSLWRATRGPGVRPSVKVAGTCLWIFCVLVLAWIPILVIQAYRALFS
jgi:hypothetical protein